jgi:hypothetical protein
MVRQGSTDTDPTDQGCTRDADLHHTRIILELNVDGDHTKSDSP